MTGPNVDAVFWDIGGVILAMESVRESHRRFVTELVESHDSTLSTEEAVETWRSELGAYFAETEGTDYRPAREGYRRAVDAILPAGTDDVDWQSLLRESAVESIRANPGAVETIEHLDDSGVTLGVISDVDEDEGRHILATLGVLDAFETVTTSEAVGRKKPDPLLFETALSVTGVDPADAAFVGDRYSHDMRGGRDAGMTTIAYGAEDGPAVDYRIDHLSEILDIVGV